MSDNAVSKEAIVIERTFDAPVDVIWQLWTQPDHFKQWYGPDGLAISVAELDVRVGGKHTVCMEGETPYGFMKIWTTGEYTEVIPNKRLVYTDSGSDGQGNLLGADGTPNGTPLITTVTVLLEDLGGRTKMVMKHAGLPDGMEGAAERWEEAITKLAARAETIHKAQ